MLFLERYSCNILEDFHTAFEVNIGFIGYIIEN